MPKAMQRRPFGRTEPRLWTKPLRELTPETSLGFEVIEFAAVILGVVLYPWQKWLLIHALELLEDGSYRFRRVIVLVARQQGKTLLASVLAAWWLFVDSARHPDRVPPVKFKVVGVAQNLDIAREPWSLVKMWCDPDPATAEEAELALPALQAATAKVSDTNGKEGIYALSRAHYEIRAAMNARGKPAARMLMDEMREQKTWAAWNAVSQTTKSFWSGQLWGISNAGDALAVVLRTQRDAGLESIADWERYVESGVQSAEEFANHHDVSLGLFEWSAPEGCALDDVDGILQANPSIGHGAMTVQSALADIRGMTEAGYRTEVLCQWVTARLDVYLDGLGWSECRDEWSVVADGSPMVLGLDTSADRKFTYLSVAGFRDDGLAHGELIARRAGMLWAVDHAVKVAAKQGIRHVALQTRGCPAAEFAKPLQDAGLEVIEIAGPALGASAGRLRDKVRDRSFRHRGQPALDVAAAGATTRRLGEVRVWDRVASVVDIGGLVSLANALYGLDVRPEPQVVASAYEEHDLIVV
ncbi:hypothetical protein [Agromyces larvae]|uniref:Terminase n=1 Tax=Agromyces larvae TaxID=2929802 RepID=A0ABY4C282_9MICO|nr:hypothetical protein [Agromyces larvae]UOE45483.1 hypothetical protein MTO99_06920 [Agromyces larvae]